MNWLSFFGPIIAGIIKGLNNFLLIKFLFFIRNEKLGSIDITKKKRIKTIKIPKENISFNKYIKRISFYRKKQYLMENQYED